MLLMLLEIALENERLARPSISLILYFNNVFLGTPNYYKAVSA